MHAGSVVSARWIATTSASSALAPSFGNQHAAVVDCRYRRGIDVGHGQSKWCEDDSKRQPRPAEITDDDHVSREVVCRHSAPLDLVAGLR